MANPPERRLCGCLTVSLFNRRICKQIRALSRQRSHKSLIVGYSTVTKALTQTGPGHYEGNSGVSVKPTIQPVLQTIRVLLKEFLVTFVSQTKVTRPSACAASGAKRCLADFASAKPCFSIRTKFAHSQLWATHYFRSLHLNGTEPSRRQQRYLR